MPTDDPSCSAELKIAPTVPAADDGVEAKIAILNTKRGQHLVSGPMVGRKHVLRVAVQNHATGRTKGKRGEAEFPVRIRRIGEW